jgi:hypothetical protein
LNLFGIILTATWAALGAAAAPVSNIGDESDLKEESSYESSDDSMEFFIGLHGAGYVPYGEWTDHIYAGRTIGGITHPADLNQVGPGGGGVLELGARTGIHDFTLQFDFNALTATDWEDYAKAQGSSLSVDLYRWDLSLIWGIEFLRISSFSLQARIGIGYTVVTGSEDNQDFKVSYDYDFFRHSFSVRAGIGAGIEVTKGLVIYLAVDQTVGVPGVDYPPEGAEIPYLGLSLSLGVRFWPVEMFGESK